MLMRGAFNQIRLNFSERPDAALMAKIEALPALAGFRPDEVTARAKNDPPFISITRAPSDETFGIRVDVAYAVSVDEAAAQAIALSQHLNDTPVRFSVNGIEMRAASHLSVESIIDQYNKVEREPAPPGRFARFSEAVRNLVAG